MAKWEKASTLALVTKQKIRVLVIQIHGDGEVQEVEQDLQTLQNLVGGYLQAVPALFDSDGNAQAMLWCNEEAKLQELPINHRATALWWALDEEMRGIDHLNGPVLITGGPDEQADIKSIPEVIEKVWISVTSAT